MVVGRSALVVGAVDGGCAVVVGACWEVVPGCSSSANSLATSDSISDVDEPSSASPPPPQAASPATAIRKPAARLVH